MKTLLLDVGSTFVKFSVYTPFERINSGFRSLPFPAPCVNDGVRFEVSRKEIDRMLKEVLDYAEATECGSIVISVQMHGYLLRDKRGFSDYVSWRDRRGDVEQPEVSSFDFAKNGTSLKRNLPAVSLCGGTYSEDTEFFTLGSYIAWVLTGRNCTHKTDACASGFFDADTLRQSFFPKTPLRLPEVTDSVTLIGNYKNIKVFAPVGDHQVCFLGSSIPEDAVFLNLGTAGQLTACVGRELTQVEGTEMRPYFLRGRRLLTVTGLDMSDDAALISEIAAKIPCFAGKTRVLLGGGGASARFSGVKERLSPMGYVCELLTENVGNVGLQRLADSLFPKKGTMLSEVVFGNFPFVMQKGGLDFFIVDHEHGDFSLPVMEQMAMNADFAGIKEIVRIPNNNRALITKLADGGVSGFLLPMTDSAADIAEVTRFALYAPLEKRGISTTRPHNRYGVPDFGAYMTEANRKMEIYAQIETGAGVENIDGILAVEGVTGVMIGPNDLSCDIDAFGQTEPLKPLIEKVCAAAVRAKKPCAIITTNRELIEYALLCGANMVSFGSEINMMKSAAKTISDDLYI